ncbi:hypothetical protein B0J11DRAFT_581968 [Dendryphion nanum]|uniref:AB hydrolase-1 domain-containing protein n=1 Tax=Dendryphion nanum TaxID=256645 RepID=A0A9P9IIZ2_9PLEO|nr:hypothetical protein B0J11DRAFT_581968 [Dendryphion nanum]
MSSKPTLILVPGSFATPDFYNNIQSPILSQSIDFHVLSLKTVGRKPSPPPTMYDDAAHIASEVAKHVEEGKEVVLVGHSYAGIPISQSTKGLTRGEREKEGKKGGIVRLGYMTAVVVPEGGSSMNSMEDMNMDHIEIGEDGFASIKDFEKNAEVVFNHLPYEEGLAWAKRFSQHSIISFANELTHPGYKDVPTSYMFCEDDKCVSPRNQQAGIDRIESASGNKVDVTRGNWDHVPTLSDTQGAVDWLVGLVEKGGN